MDKTMACWRKFRKMAKGLLCTQNCKENLAPQKNPSHLSLYSASGASPSSVGEVLTRDLNREPSTEAVAATGGQDQLINGNQTQVLTSFPSTYKPAIRTVSK